MNKNHSMGFFSVNKNTSSNRVLNHNSVSFMFCLKSWCQFWVISFSFKKNISSFSGIQEWAEAAISSGADDSVSMFFEAHGSSTSGELVQHQWGVGPTCRGFHGSRLQGASSDEEVEESFLVEIWCVFFFERFRMAGLAGRLWWWVYFFFHNLITYSRIGVLLIGINLTWNALRQKTIFCNSL